MKNISRYIGLIISISILILSLMGGHFIFAGFISLMLAVYFYIKSIIKEDLQIQYEQLIAYTSLFFAGFVFKSDVIVGISLLLIPFWYSMFYHMFNFIKNLPILVSYYSRAEKNFSKLSNSEKRMWFSDKDVKTFIANHIFSLDIVANILKQLGSK